MPDAHAAAVEAMAGALDIEPFRCGVCDDRDLYHEADYAGAARRALAALSTSVAVREALVGAAMPAVPRENVAPLLGGNPDLTAYYQRRAEAVVDAILAALAPGSLGSEERR